MESTYYFIIVGVLLFEYALSTISSTLNMNSITEDIPDGFQDYYDKDKYAKSQSYLKDKTRFGLFTGTFSLCITLIIIHAGLFGLLDDFVRAYSNHYITSGLLFFGTLFTLKKA